MASTSGAGARVRAVPERQPELTHLSLPALRDYRAALGAEESRVSYWRRILQARLDLVRGLRGARPDPARMRTVLTEQRMGTGRRALLAVLPADDIPPLPNLAGLWEQPAGADDDPGREALLADLEAAERQLSAYRAALHRRLAAATAELIARYRADPLLCLSVLPSDPLPRRAVGA